MKAIVTNGGPHPAEELAMATAEQITQVDPSISPDRMIAAQKLRAAMAEALLPHHVANQSRERQRLMTGGEPESLTEHVRAAFRDVLATTKGSLWEAVYALPANHPLVWDAIKRFFQIAIQIEQDWHRIRAEQGKSS